MFDSIAANIDAMRSGVWILGILGVLCVWVWTLIIVMAQNLRTAVRPGDDGLVDGYAAFCKHLAGTGLRAKLQKRIAQAHAEGAVRRAMGSVPTVLLLSSVAPLLGLLGTVEGMIGTFQALATSGSGDTAALTSGISKALVTTQGGLLVAIPSLLAGGVLHRKTQKLRDKLQSTALRTVTTPVPSVHQGGPA